MSKQLFVRAISGFAAGLPLVPGSVVSFVIMLLYIPIIIKRIRNEELVLAEGLSGY